MGAEGVIESLEATKVSSHDSGLQTKMSKYLASAFQTCQTLRLHMCSNNSHPLKLEPSTRTRKPHTLLARM